MDYEEAVAEIASRRLSLMLVLMIYIDEETARIVSSEGLGDYLLTLQELSCRLLCSIRVNEGGDPDSSGRNSGFNIDNCVRGGCEVQIPVF